METKYILVEWPESQKWIGHPDCYLAAGESDDDRFFQPMYFVPENIYNLSKKNNMTINSLYNIDDEFSYWNFDHSKKLHIKITAIIIRKEGVYYEVEGDTWEDEFSEETIKTMYYENSNTRTLD